MFVIVDFFKNWKSANPCRNRETEAINNFLEETQHETVIQKNAVGNLLSKRTNVDDYAESSVS